MQEKIPLSQGRHFQGKRRITCVSKAANRSNKMKSEIGFSDRKVIGGIVFKFSFFSLCLKQMKYFFCLELLKARL